MQENLLPCSRKLEVPVILAMHKKAPAGPFNWLPFKYRLVSLFSKEIFEGIWPEKLFVGRYKEINPVKADIDDDIVPIKLKPSKFNSLTSALLPQLTPVHASAPAPQGYGDIAEAPLQVQPTSAPGEIVGYIEGANDVGDVDEDAVGAAVGAAVGLDGQFVIPNLNAHNASASDCCWAKATNKT